MPTVTYQFDTFATSGTGVDWTNPGNAEDADGIVATAVLSSGSPTTKLLVCTGASISLPDTAVITNIRVKIKGFYTAGGISGARIHEIYPWAGSGLSGGVPSTSRNQAGTYIKSTDTGPITLVTTNTVYPARGTVDWLWWTKARLTDSNFGVAIRAERTSGSPTVNIDHVELEVTYVVLHAKTPIVDYRVVAYDRVAGATTGSDTNEYGEEYQPGNRGPGQPTWHADPVGFLQDMIADRTKHGINRIVLGAPAGDIGGTGEVLVASSQWVPMFDNQRAALTNVVPTWLSEDPEREVIMYLGTNLALDLTSLSMIGSVEPDVTVTAHVEKLERTFFPYRDCVGIRRFFLDASAPIDRTKARALFAWGRTNGMEFVMEAIPHTGSALDETITEAYGAFALSGYIIGDNQGRTGEDTGHLWSFTKGRLYVQVNCEWHDEAGTDAGKRALMQRFAREGYVLMPRTFDGSCDAPGALVSREHEGRGVTGSVSGPVSSGVSNSVTRFRERS